MYTNIQCELCGAETPDVIIITLEIVGETGTLLVCEDCKENHSFGISAVEYG